MSKYCAIAVGLQKDGHGVQALFSSKQQAIEWATITTTSYKVTVDIFEIVENRIASTSIQDTVTRVDSWT